MTHCIGYPSTKVAFSEKGHGYCPQGEDHMLVQALHNEQLPSGRLSKHVI